jgi:hypothetical protein
VPEKIQGALIYLFTFIHYKWTHSVVFCDLGRQFKLIHEEVGGHVKDNEEQKKGHLHFKC